LFDKAKVLVSLIAAVAGGGEYPDGNPIWLTASRSFAPATRPISGYTLHVQETNYLIGGDGFDVKAV
jgi:hypothetical protein